jgi:hypothetical protein
MAFAVHLFLDATPIEPKPMGLINDVMETGRRAVAMNRAYRRLRKLLLAIKHPYRRDTLGPPPAVPGVDASLVAAVRSELATETGRSAIVDTHVARRIVDRLMKNHNHAMTASQYRRAVHSVRVKISRLPGGL